jgi:hypothetical protein
VRTVTRRTSLVAGAILRTDADTGIFGRPNGNDDACNVSRKNTDFRIIDDQLAAHSQKHVDASRFGRFRARRDALSLGLASV